MPDVQARTSYPRQGAKVGRRLTLFSGGSNVRFWQILLQKSVAGILAA
jgi:hypothetical protein